MPHDDVRLLQHMLDHAREASTLAAQMTQEQFERSRLAQHGLTRVTQIIGEAAWRVSAEFKSAHSEIPWKQIEGYRHRVVHDYFSVDYDTVWRVATVHAPALSAQLEKLLASPESEKS